MYFDSPSAGNKVFVGGLAGITHRDLYDGFSWFGPIANVKIVTDHYTGGPRGFGFVTFMDALSAQHAIQAGCGYSASGIRLTVRPAHPKAHRQADGNIMLQHWPSSHRPKTMLKQPAQPAQSQQRVQSAKHTPRCPSVMNPPSSVTSSAKATASAFLDIIHQAPRLLEMLPQDSLKALLATSRNLRAAVHDMTTVLTIEHEADIACLLKGDWPHLGLVIMRNQEYGYSSYSQLLTPKWRLLARLDLSTRCFGSMDVVFLLQPLQHPQLMGHDKNRFYAQPLRHLLGTDWSGLRKLDLSQVKSSSMGLAVMAQLSQGDWPLLTSLDLSDNKLGADSMSEITKRKFPALESLDVSSNKLDVEAMRQLVKGDWPTLKYLWLSINPLLNAEGIKQLASAKWSQLHDLSLSYTSVTAEMMEELVKLPLPRLKTLSLSGCGLDVPAVSVLARANWPALRSLRLTENRLPAEAVSQLIRGRFPALRLLDLANCKMDAASVQCLIQGDWPLLEDIDMSYNQLDTEAIKYLLKPQWTSMTNLSLNHNTFDVHAVEDLTTGDWPLLRFLCLDFQVLNTANAGMLGICMDELKEFENEKARTQSCVVQISRDCTSLWRKLKHVLVI